ncbi:MAG TPA: hypothetical protein VIX17_09650 [Pyrinomonadaceae bacterium]|jgi:hypothetical protein
MNKKGDTSSIIQVVEDVNETRDGIEKLLKADDENKKPLSESLFKQPSTPLFLIDGSEGKKGNAQDEKDESEE